MKEFGGNRSAPRRDEFVLKYLDANEEQQEAHFRVVPRVSGGDIAGILRAMNGNAQESVGRLIRLLGKVMDNRDGLVPAQWRPDVLPQKDDDERPKSFRGPDGEIYALSNQEKLDEFADMEKWTSRRRWNYLLDEDDDAVVEIDDLSEIAEWVIGLSTDRPTPPRA